MPLVISENTNLFDQRPDAYAQGCNMQGKMGHGIAVTFRQLYPEMYKEYVKYCDSLPKPKIPGGFFFWPESDLPAVYNLFTQLYIGKDGRLDAVEKSFNAMFAHADAHGIETIAIPAIGCGVAGLRWKDVKFIIENCLRVSNFKGTVQVCFQLKEF